MVVLNHSTTEMAPLLALRLHPGMSPIVPSGYAGIKHSLGDFTNMLRIGARPLEKAAIAFKVLRTGSWQARGASVFGRTMMPIRLQMPMDERRHQTQYLDGDVF